MSDNDPDRKPATGPLGTRDQSGFSIRASYFWWGVAALVVLVFGGIWLSIPGAETKHRLTSPSGEIWLDVGEMCGETSCGQIVVVDFPDEAGERHRNPCETGLREDRSVFVTVSAEWLDNETRVILTYADANGQGGTLDLNLPVDCAV